MVFNFANNGDFTPRYSYNPASHDGGRGNQLKIFYYEQNLILKMSIT